MTVPPDNPRTTDVPICEERLTDCLASAWSWSGDLPRFADSCQSKADRWAIAAGILAASTSVSVYPLLTKSDAPWAKFVLSFIAMLSAISALVPRVKNYGEQAGTARVLAAQYGSVYGRLLDIVRDTDLNQRAARLVVDEYQAIKAKKDTLRGITTWTTKHRSATDDKRTRTHRDEEPSGPPPAGDTDSADRTGAPSVTPTRSGGYDAGTHDKSGDVETAAETAATPAPVGG